MSEQIIPIMPIQVGQYIFSFRDRNDFLEIPFSREVILQWAEKMLGRPLYPADAVEVFRAHMKAVCRSNLKAKDGKFVQSRLRFY